jgi:hypothetical protein
MNSDRGRTEETPPTRFAELLRWHLRHGTRPDGTPGILGRPWTIKGFADEIGVPHDTFRRWLSGARCPKYTIRIELGFFGSGLQWEACRRQLRAAHEATQSRSRPVRPVGADVVASMQPVKYQPLTQPRRLIFEGIQSGLAHESRGISISIPVGQGMTATAMISVSAIIRMRGIAQEAPLGRS